MEVSVLADAFQMQMLGAEGLALVEALLARFSSYCKERNAKDAELFRFEDRHASCCQTPTQGSEEHARENPLPPIIKLSQSDEVMIPILAFFCSNADCFPPAAACSILGFTWALLGCVPRATDASWATQSDWKAWQKLPEHSYLRSPGLLTELLNLLSLLQALSPEQQRLRQAVSKIGHMAFNENLFGVSSLATAIISEFEVENQFDF